MMLRYYSLLVYLTVDLATDPVFDDHGIAHLQPHFELTVFELLSYWMILVHP